MTPRIVAFTLVFVMSAAASESSAFKANDVRAHADTVMARLGADSLSREQKLSLLKNPLPFNLAIVFPVIGTTLVDMHMFGEFRRSAILGDWILGGAVPVVMSTVAVAADAIPQRGRHGMLYGSLGLYLATRVLVCVTINHHLATYNRHVRLTLGL